MSHSFGLDHTQALTLTLPAPVAKPGASAGTPAEASIDVWAGSGITVGVWECSPGSWPSAREGYSEVMVFLTGRGTITSQDGTSQEIAPGATVITPDGWRGTWQVHETVRKIYVITDTVG